MNINRNDLCPCGSGKKYKNCCYNNTSTKEVEPIKEEFGKEPEAVEQLKEEKVTINERVILPDVDVRNLSIEDSHDEITYETEHTLLEKAKEHAKKLEKIREENKDNPNYPSGNISWKEIKKIREDNKDNPNYPHVYWVNSDKGLLYVKIGETEKEGITVSEAIELFKNNKLFMDELKFLLEDYVDMRTDSLEDEYSHNAHL